MVKALRLTLAATVLFAVGASSARAQVVRVGATNLAIGFGTRGSNVAYDSTSNVYLVVSTYGVLRGQFVDRNGAAIGGAFIIQANPGFFSHFPNVTFSPDADGGAGAFLVVWHQSDLPTGTSIHTRIVSYTKGGPIGNDNQVSVEGAFWERYPGVAYSSGSREFLVTYPKVTRGIRGVRCGLDGAALAAPFTIAVNGQNEEWSSASYNPTNNQYVVAYEGFVDGPGGFVAVRAVQAGTDVPLGAQPVTLFAGGANYINEIVYNPNTNQFLVAWYRDTGASKATLGRIVNPDLSLPGSVTAISSLWKAYDGLGLAYNKITKTSYMVSHDGRGLPTSYEDGGVEVKADGNPVDNGMLVTSSLDAKPNFYPKIAAGTADPNWLVVTSHNFAYTAMQLLAGTPTGPASSPQMALENPTGGSLTYPFTVTGWAVDLGSSSGSGSDWIDFWAWPTAGGAPTYLGNTSPSNPRSDVAALYGAQFMNSGFTARLTGLTTPGAYTIGAYMRSTVTGTFNAVRTVNVVITGPGGGETLRASDFDGDGRSELTVYNASTGMWSILKSTSGYSSVTGIGWGGAGYTPVSGDYDGDGKSDIGIYEESSGNWYVLLSSTGFSSSLFKNCGGPGWKPVQGDYDGDGKTDFAVYNSTSGIWYGLKSGSGYAALAVGWGGTGYTAAPGDFDGDGKIDLAVYHEATGYWYVLLSASGYTTSTFRSAGGPHYMPVPGDYDGDGKTDFAVYNTVTGLWFGFKSSTGTAFAVNWGGTGYTPIRGDYDGDGKADLAIFRGSTGQWFVVASSTGVVKQIGLGTSAVDDVPLSGP